MVLPPSCPFVGTDHTGWVGMTLDGDGEGQEEGGKQYRHPQSTSGALVHMDTLDGTLTALTWHCDSTEAGASRTRPRRLSQAGCIRDTIARKLRTGGGSPFEHPP
jgi:hypothetical protein